MKNKTMKEYFEEGYEEIIVGFILELNNNGVPPRELGTELAKITEIMRCWNA